MHVCTKLKAEPSYVPQLELGAAFLPPEYSLSPPRSSQGSGVRAVTSDTTQPLLFRLFEDYSRSLLKRSPVPFDQLCFWDAVIKGMHHQAWLLVFAKQNMSL